MKKRWIIFSAFMLLFAVLGFFADEAPDTFALSENINTADVAWMITATIFVLMMTPGLSFFYGGMVRKKNIISTILQSIIAMGVISVIWVVFGFSLAFGENIGGVIGNPSTYFLFNNVGGAATDKLATELGLTIPLALYALFQMKFAIITPSLITGSFSSIYIYCKPAFYTLSIKLWSLSCKSSVMGL